MVCSKTYSYQGHTHSLDCNHNATDHNAYLIEDKLPSADSDHHGPIELAKTPLLRNTHRLGINLAL